MGVLTEVLKHAGDVLVVHDGSTDPTSGLAPRRFPTVRTIRHPRNLGYGAGLRTAFQATIDGGYDGLVTLDCDGQHEPERIPEVASRLSRMPNIRSRAAVTCTFSIPARRLPNMPRRINVEVTRWLNECPGFEFDQRFLRLQGYRTSALKQ